MPMVDMQMHCYTYRYLDVCVCYIDTCTVILKHVLLCLHVTMCVYVYAILTNGFPPFARRLLSRASRQDGLHVNKFNQQSNNLGLDDQFRVGL